MANYPLNSMGIYTAYDRAPLPCIGDLRNGLHTDLKFQNHGYTMLFVRATWGEGRQSCGEKKRHYRTRSAEGRRRMPICNFLLRMVRT